MPLTYPMCPSDLAQRDGRAVRKGNEIAKLYADNKVDVIIYAVEKSLDSYKFNLLHPEGFSPSQPLLKNFRLNSFHIFFSIRIFLYFWGEYG